MLRNWLKAYAAATASVASYQTILGAATPGEADKPARDTTLNYRNTLELMWTLDDVEAWLPLGGTFGNVGKTSKHYIVDPAITAVLMDVTRDTLVMGEDMPLLLSRGKTVLGRLFEALLAQSLHTYSAACGAQLRHFRTSTGNHEVDFIIEKGRNIVALEVKVSPEISDKDVRHLKWFAETFSQYRVVLGGEYAYTRKDGVHVIPASLLGV
jgi:predicted AAA+ superfamily ATPase